MNEVDVVAKRVQAINELIADAYKSLDKIKSMLDTLSKEVKSDAYRGMEGVVGVFDGTHLVDSSGIKHDIPANYAAKSRLVYGDSIKMVEDNGQTVFKQIQKVERKKTEGVLSKKEGKWYILTDSGSYKVSDVAAEFQQAELNDEAIAFLPAQNLNAPFATIDTVLKKNPPSPVAVKKPEVSSHSVVKAVVPKPAAAPTAKPKAKSPAKKPYKVSSKE